MKRYFGGLLTLALLALVLTACSGTLNDNPGQGGSSGNKVTGQGEAQGTVTGPAGMTAVTVSPGGIVRGGMTSGPNPTTLPAGITTYAVLPTGGTPAPSLAASLTGKGTNILPYENMKVFTPPADFKKTMEDQFQQGYASTPGGKLGNVQFNYYTSSDDPGRVVSYYQGEATKNGYKQAGYNEIDPISLGGSKVGGKVGLFSKDPSKVGGAIFRVTILGPLDDNTAQYFNAANVGIKSRDIIIMTGQGDVVGS